MNPRIILAISFPTLSESLQALLSDQVCGFSKSRVVGGVPRGALLGQAWEKEPSKLDPCLSLL